MDGDRYFSTIRQLAEYEVWCNRAALGAAAALAHGQLFQPFPFGFGTIHRTLFHTLNVFGHWSGHVAPVEVDPPWLKYDAALAVADLERLHEGLAAEFLRAIDASHAAGLLGQDRRLVQVFHLVTHGTHHRTQFISMLRMLGIDPPFEAGDFAGWQRRATRTAT